MRRSRDSVYKAEVAHKEFVRAVVYKILRPDSNHRPLLDETRIGSNPAPIKIILNEVAEQFPNSLKLQPYELGNKSVGWLIEKITASIR